MNGRRRDGLTALHGATFRGHCEVIRYLLDHGADRAMQGESGPHQGQTAHDVAIAQNQARAAALL